MPSHPGSTALRWRSSHRGPVTLLHGSGPQFGICREGGRSMHEFAALPQEDRADALIVAAREKGMHPAIVEKDFWVCWTLDYLFGGSAYKDSFAFKGGTSLSKGFGLIERFSEDIDLIFDWRLLGYGLDEPWEERSNTKQDAFVRRLDEDTASFLREELMPAMQAYMTGDMTAQQVTEEFQNGWIVQ